MTVCSVCVMDDSDPDFVYYGGENGCNHCLTYRVMEPFDVRDYEEFEEILEKIKASRPGYNCVLGISGGLDSTMTAYIAHQAGLKALLIHLDNGFDTPEAQHNIERIRENTKWEMLTSYVDGPEYRDIQLAYLKAGVRNIEAVTDHAISALVYRVAIGHNIKYVLSGGNWATEGILPKAWGHDSRDLKNIKAIHKAHGSMQMDRFFGMGLLQRMIIERFTLKIVKPLNYVGYNTKVATKTLKTEWGFQEYGDKHGENRLTRFYQKQILPVRWGIDKRRAHLSALICNGEITRDEALNILERCPADYEQSARDQTEVQMKMNISRDELQDYLITTPWAYAEDYPNNAQYIDRLRAVRDSLRRR